MKKNYLVIICMGLLLSACSTQESIASITSYPAPPSSSSSSSVESVSLLSDDPQKERTDDSLPYSTIVNNSFEEKTVAEILSDFKKEKYGYYDGAFDDSRKLPSPSNTVKNHQELVDLFDYAAFYRVKEVLITFDMKGNLFSECNLAVWDSFMLPGTVGTKFTVGEGSNQMKAEFKFVDDANSFVPKKLGDGATPSYFPYIYDYADENKEKISDVPYVGETPLDVYNSDQLIYAIAHNYRPIMAEDSPAKKIYDEARRVLKNIIYKDMKDNEKLTAIEFYLSNNCVYDYTSDENASYISQIHENNPEELASMFRGFYAEGALFNGQAVCYGFSKAQALLSGLLGFDIRLTHGKIDLLSRDTNDAVVVDEITGNIYNAHGISLVKAKGSSRWGICDPTFRSAGSVTVNSDRVEFKRYPAIMMSVSEWQKTYDTADEVAFQYLSNDELVEESYNFVDDYNLVGGAKLNPKTERDIKNTFTGIINTIVKAKEMLNDQYSRYFVVTLYPSTETEGETMELIGLIESTLSGHKIYEMDIARFYYRQAEYFKAYGYTIYVRY